LWSEEATPGKHMILPENLLKQKVAGGVAQVIACLPSECESLSSNHSKNKNFQILKTAKDL
jgi:hypothetical protein